MDKKKNITELWWKIIAATANDRNSFRGLKSKTRREFARGGGGSVGWRTGARN